jgi:hypothetical protein
MAVMVAMLQGPAGLMGQAKKLLKASLLHIGVSLIPDFFKGCQIPNKR